jgi:starch synthase
VTLIDPLHPAGFFSQEHFYDYENDFERFTYFCRASLELLVKLGKQADILHLHNWQTAAVAPLFWDIFVHQVSVTVVQQRERKYLSRLILFFIVLL